ncbi:hypothetical protein [Ekhidna sp.]|uniref:hypothetical protein n=1 Tax=Ekhidna sp. TaxID=2608089 RepID=UPI0032EE13B4
MTFLIVHFYSHVMGAFILSTDAPRSYSFDRVMISADARQACTLFLSGVPHLISLS